MQPFTLDEDAATRWLELVVAAAAYDREAIARLEEEYPNGGESPDFDATWNPREFGEENTVYRLVITAQEAGLISRPRGCEVLFECIHDDDGDHFRTLVYLSEPIALRLVSMTEDMQFLGGTESEGKDAIGVPAALTILRDTVQAANAVTEALAHYTARGPADEAELIA